MPNLVDMLEAGVHFGHKKERSHPKAKEFIFMLRDGVYVIDLDKTVSCLSDAIAYLKKQLDAGKTILFVGTKRQAKEYTKALADDLGMPYIIHRWLGGTMTNFETIKKNLKELDRLESQVKSEEFKEHTKKEQKVIKEKMDKLLLTFGGVRKMNTLPDVLFVVDSAGEDLAVTEANKMEIPIVGTCDTDADPSKLTYAIPANDEAIKSLEMIFGELRAGLLGTTKPKAIIKEKNEKEETKSDEKSDRQAEKGKREKNG